MEDNKFIIRNYRKSDYGYTLAILNELEERYKIGISEENWKESSGLRVFKPNLKRITLVAEIDGMVVSMGMIEAKKDSFGHYIGELNNWATKKEYIGKGIGKILADKAIKVLKSWGVDKVQIYMSYTADKKLIDTICKGGGFEPRIIILEKTIEDEQNEK
jgi:ribosomal protein S18 acetylase RimI-like enzyme